MHEKNDFLYQIFEKQLLQPSDFEQSFEDFTNEVVAYYLFELAQQGVLVPTQLRDIMEQDLCDEVQDMLRKKTYGFSSLREYRHKFCKIA